MYKYVGLLLLMCSCTITQKPIESSKVLQKKDWLQIYENEIIIAIRNEDMESYYFFRQELLMELLRKSGATNVRITE